MEVEVREIHVQQATLGAGVPLVYRNSGRRVRMAYDPRQTTLPRAVDLLRLFLHRADRAVIVHRAPA